MIKVLEEPVGDTTHNKKGNKNRNCSQNNLLKFLFSGQLLLFQV